MDAIMIKSRYKVTHILHAQRDYAAVLAVDVESREMNEYLLNIYENEYKRQYISCYESLRRCPEFINFFIDDGALFTVFQLSGTGNIDSVFYKGAVIGREERMLFAHNMMQLALNVSALPSRIGCAAMLSQNLIVQRNTGRVSVNYMVPPMEGLNTRELIFLLSDQIGKILTKRWESPDAEIEFVDRLKSGEFTSISMLYSHWLEVRRVIHDRYLHIYNKNALSRALYLVYLNGRRAFLKKYAARGKGKGGMA